MSMSTYVIGFHPPDAKWQQMKAVWDSCRSAGVDPPDEVLSFFDHEPPDDAGVKINLEEHACCSKYGEDMTEGFEIDISKLPPNITKIRFYNSW